MAVIVDSGDLARTGAIATDHGAWLERARIVNIDHHVSNPGFGAVNLIDAEAASTCEMVALLLPDLGVELGRGPGHRPPGRDRERHPHLRPPQRHPANAAVAAHPGRGRRVGWRPSIARSTPRNPTSTIAVWGRILNGVGFAAGGRIVHAADRGHAGRDWRHPRGVRGFIDLLGLSRDADIVVLFKEHGPTETRVSIRTSEVADAVAITSALAGVAMPGRRAAPSRHPSPRPGSRSWPSASGSCGAPMIGVINLDKPVGPTSHDMVGLVRRLTGLRRIGHAGTLDPLASGVLPILVGACHPAVQELTGGRKRYDALVRLGFRSRTDDGEGPIEPGTEPPSEDAVRAVLPEFVGTFAQQAAGLLRAQGRRCGRVRGRARGIGCSSSPARSRSTPSDCWTRRRARAGSTSASTSRPGPGPTSDPLARDLGERLGCGGYLHALRRTEAAGLSADRGPNAG